MTEILTSVLLFLLSLFGGGDSTTDSVKAQVTYPPEVTAEVTRVIDGDTIDVRIDGTIERIRYIGIDTPEPHEGETPECYSTEATDANRSFVRGKSVRLVADAERRDDYGRMLRYVYVGDTFVNAELLRGGYGRLLVVPPNTQEYGNFLEIRNESRAAERGLWGVCE